MILATLFSPKSLSAALVPLLAMTLVAGLWMWRDRVTEQTAPGTLKLASPISLTKCCGSGRCLSQFKLPELSVAFVRVLAIACRLVIANMRYGLAALSQLLKFNARGNDVIVDTNGAWFPAPLANHICIGGGFD